MLYKLSRRASTYPLKRYSQVVVSIAMLPKGWVHAGIVIGMGQYTLRKDLPVLQKSGQVNRKCEFC